LARAAGFIPNSRRITLKRLTASYPARLPTNEARQIRLNFAAMFMSHDRLVQDVERVRRFVEVAQSGVAEVQRAAGQPQQRDDPEPGAEMPHEGERNRRWREIRELDARRPEQHERRQRDDAEDERGQRVSFHRALEGRGGHEQEAVGEESTEAFMVGLRCVQESGQPSNPIVS
jgi:hypothetical protein